MDTDVIVAALRSPSGASAQLLSELDDNRSDLLLSVTLAIEYESVCRRPEHRLASRVSETEVDDFIERLVDIAKPVHIDFAWRPLLRDPADEMVLETAINGRADALVTFNLKHFGDAPSRFGIDLLNPGEALWRMRR